MINVRARLNTLRYKLRANSNGSTLILVVVLCAVTAILLTAVATTVLSANTVSSQHVQEQQAYFTARSAVNTMVATVTNSANASLLPGIIPQTVNATVPSNIASSQWSQMTADGKNMGWYALAVKRMDSKTIKISATARYPDKNNGTSRTVSRYLVKSDDQLKQVYKNIFYINSPSGTNLGQSTINGNVTTSGSLSFGNGTAIKGSITTNGTVTVTGGASGTITALNAVGDLNVDSGGTITNGDVYVTGNVTLSGGGTINGNVYTNGSLTITQGGHITGNVTVGGNATFSGGPTLDGNLTTGGTYSFLNKGPVIKGKILQNQTVPTIVLTAPKPITQAISIPTAAENPQLYAPTVFSSTTTAWSGTYGSATISQDCTFDLSGYSFSYGAPITVDATSSDISLLITKDTAIDGKKLLVKGDHNLYIYLTNNANLNISSNVYAGLPDTTANPRVYIMGNGTSAINMTSNSSLNACVYLPNGSFSANGSAFSDYEPQKFRGSIAAKTISVDSSVIMDYLSSDVTTSTPLESAFSSWTPGSWTQGGLWGS
jgi:hypothetical protein